MLLPEEINAFKNYYIGARKNYLKSNIAPRLLDSYDRYVLYHVGPGAFLTAVLDNDLTEAFARADENNTIRMREHASFVYTVMSQGLRGRINREAWLAQYEEPTKEMLVSLAKQATLGALHGD